MNPRERMLAAVIGAVALLMALWFGWSYIDGQFRTRRTTIGTLEKDIRTFKLQAMQGQQATQKLAEYEARSLPPDPELARSLYQNWLLDQVSKAGFTDQEVQAKARTAEGDLYVSQAYIVTGRGTLPQVIDFLHAFYSVDYLHRARLVMLKPIKESKQLEVTLNIDAVSLSGAPVATTLHNRPSKRLAKPKKEDYYAAILGRNLFGPPNRAPALSIGGSKDVAIGRPAQLTATAPDPDPLDRVHYRLVESASPDARLDPASGRFTWTPKTLGKHKFVIEAYDDGLPSKPARQELVLNVVEPKVEAPKTGFTGFDAAKFTVLTAVIDVSGQSEIWLHNRPEGKMLRLHVGDDFHVGSIAGTIQSIGQTEFTFLSDGKLRRVEQGGILEQAATLPQAAIAPQEANSPQAAIVPEE